jgi:hypothetical protein
MEYDENEIMSAAKKAGIKLVKSDSQNNVIYPDGTEKYIDVRIKKNKKLNDREK